MNSRTPGKALLNRRDGSLWLFENVLLAVSGIKLAGVVVEGLLVRQLFPGSRRATQHLLSLPTLNRVWISYDIRILDDLVLVWFRISRQELRRSKATIQISKLRGALMRTLGSRSGAWSRRFENALIELMDVSANSVFHLLVILIVYSRYDFQLDPVAFLVDGSLRQGSRRSFWGSEVAGESFLRACVGIGQGLIHLLGVYRVHFKVSWAQWSSARSPWLT